jgi:hypothetical protein
MPVTNPVKPIPPISETKYTGRLLRITRYVSGSGTFTKLTDTKSILIRTIAGGGGASGADTTQGTLGQGGGGGGASELFIAVAANSYAYTVGAGGAGSNVNSGQNGFVGGQTTISSISGGGGKGGLWTPSTVVFAGSIPIGGDINISSSGMFQSSLGGNGAGPSGGGNNFGSGGYGGLGQPGTPGNSGYIEISEFS